MWHSDFKIDGVAVKAWTERQQTADYESNSAASFYQKVRQLVADLTDKKAPLYIETSGSTGPPKKLALSYRQMLASADLTLTHFRLQPEAKVLLCLPMTAISGVMMVVRAMRGGLDLYLQPPSAQPLKPYQSQGNGFFDFIAMTPYQLTHSIAHLDLAKRVLVGGAALTPDHMVALPSHTKTKIVESYGMTETLTHVALRERFPRNEPYFKALGDVHFELGSANNLVIYAPHLQEAPYVTSDEVRLLSETEFDYLGRTDHVINSGGIKFFSAAIEQKLQHLISENFFVYGRPHDTLGEQIVLVVEGASTDRIHALVQALDAVQWKPYERPKEVLTLNRFRFTHTQKIDRRATFERLDL